MLHGALESKMSLYDINSRSTVVRYQSDIKKYLFNYSLSDNLDYHQKVYAFYSEISFPLAKLFDAKLGGRSRQNIGTEKNAGINFFADLHISSKFLTARHENNLCQNVISRIFEKKRFNFSVLSNRIFYY